MVLRQLRNQNIYNLVNLLSITLSITSSILLFLYLRNEFTFDQYNSEIPVYRIASNAVINGNEIITPTTPSALGPSLDDILSCRISTQSNIPIGVADRLFNENDIYAVDSSFFELFPMKLTSGNENLILSENSIVLTKSLASKLFNYEDPIGKIVSYGNTKKIVTAIVQDPLHSHLNFKGLVLQDQNKRQWITFSDYTYIKTNKPIKDVNEQLKKVYESSMEPLFTPNNSSCSFFLQPLESIYLKSHLQGELDINGNESIDIALIIIGVFMLIIAGINYTNMTTARSIRRYKEIAIRKAVGSYRSELMWQFIVESVLLVFFGVFLSLIIIDQLLPYIHFITDVHIYSISIMDWQLVIFVFIVVAGIGLMGSIYPAFYMTKFTVAETLSGSFLKLGSKITKRRILLFIQFSISILLIICTWAIKKQINYVNDKNLGFNPSNVMTLRLPDYTDESTQLFIKDVGSLDQIMLVGTAEIIPGEEKETLTSFFFLKDKNSTYEQILVKYFYADMNFIHALEIDVLQGTGFESNNQKVEILINEALVGLLQPAENIVGMDVSLPFTGTGGTNEARIVGIIKNTHFKSLHQKVQPVAILYKPHNSQALLRFKQNEMPNIAAIQKIFQNNFPDFPFDYSFLEDRIDNLYRQDLLTSRLFGIFAIITTSLALMGVFALSFYTSEIRKKEICIRKISGASLHEILYIINREYFLIVGLAALIASPVAYVIIDQWLAGFEYKVQPGYFVFIFTMASSIIVALATVSINTIKAAKSNIITTINRG